MEAKTKWIIGISIGVLAIGGFATYKYMTDWKFKDGDSKVEGGKLVSVYDDQSKKWIPYTTKDMGLDQEQIDKTNEKYKKFSDGVYRKGVKV